MRRFYLSCLIVLVCFGVSIPSSAETIPRPKTSMEDGFYVFTFDDSRAIVSTKPDYNAGGWQIDCRVSATMNDQRFCRVLQASYGGVSLIYFYSAVPKLVCIFGKKFPGTTGQILIDNNTAQTTDEIGCVKADGILDQLLSGSSVLTRAYYWPKNEPVDIRSSLKGLHKAMEIADRIRSQ